MVKEQTVDGQATTNLTPAQESLQALWEEHLGYEFGTHSTEDALATMVEDAYVNHIPVMTGGVGKPALREFYSKYFIPQMPPDMELTPISRTIGTDRLVDEMVAKFTHTIQMDWMLPGVAPTGKRVEVPVVAIVQFRDGKLAHEHLYWDQASVLVQLGLLDPGTLPVVGIDSVRKAIDPNLPSNTLIDGAFHMTQRDAVFPAGRHDLYRSHTYSAAIGSGDLLFVSGQVGSRSDGSPEPDFEAQVRLAFSNLEATLQAGGCGLDDIVDVTTFHTDPENQFGTVMTVKSEVFPEAPYPNWTAIGVNWLAGFDFEIKVIARIPG